MIVGQIIITIQTHQEQKNVSIFNNTLSTNSRKTLTFRLTGIFVVVIVVAAVAVQIPIFQHKIQIKKKIQLKFPYT